MGLESIISNLLLSEAGKQGIWAVLFISLFVYQLKETRRQREESLERENQLQNFLNDLGEHLRKLTVQYERLANDVEEIKDAFPRQFPNHQTQKKVRREVDYERHSDETKAKES